MKEIDKIRKSERRSHEMMYTKYDLFAKGSWLEKPVQTVINILSMIECKESINILDLGCGVGRNAIPIALHYKEYNCMIDAVDILDIAIKKLRDYSIYYGVDNMINGITSSVEDYYISNHKYDLILAISVLEHLENMDFLLKKLYEIRDGLKQNGIACFICNSNIEEKSILTNQQLSPQFECLFSDEEFYEMMAKVFEDFELLKRTLKKQVYTIPRENEVVKMETDVVTYVIKKR